MTTFIDAARKIESDSALSPFNPPLKFSLNVGTQIHSFDYFFYREGVHLLDSTFERTAYLIRSILGNVTSKESLIFKNCPQLEDITADKHVILINCPRHGTISAGGDVWRLGTTATGDIKKINAKGITYSEMVPSPKETVYVNETIEKPLQICTPIAKFINCKVTASIWFETTTKIAFEGILILEGATEIFGLSSIDATIVDNREKLPLEEKSKES